MPDSIAPGQFLEKIASRLGKDGFSVQRRVPAGKYVFDTLASRIIPAMTIRGAQGYWSNAVAVVSMDAVRVEDVRDQSSFAANYVLENRSSLRLGRVSLSTIAAIVSTSLGEDVKRWVMETQPEYSLMWDRSQFPVLVDLDNREIIYYKGSLVSHSRGPAYGSLRAFSDGWFGFYISDDTNPLT